MEDSAGYLKGPYRKVIEGAVLKLKQQTDRTSDELSTQFT